MRITHSYRPSISPCHRTSPSKVCTPAGKTVTGTVRFARRTHDDAQFGAQVEHFIRYNSKSVLTFKAGFLAAVGTAILTSQLGLTVWWPTFAVAALSLGVSYALRKHATRSPFFAQMWKTRGSRLKTNMSHAQQGQILQVYKKHAQILKNILNAASYYTRCCTALRLIDRYRICEKEGAWTPLLPYRVRAYVAVEGELLGQKYPEISMVILLARREQIAAEMPKLIDYLYNGAHAWQAPSEQLDAIRGRLQECLKHIR